MKKKPIVLVTGASSGIGLGIALALKQQGFKVYGTSRSPQSFLEIRWIILDVTSQQSCRDCIEEIIEREGRLDVLINNAGLGMISSLEEAPDDNIRRVIETNFYGTMWMIQEALPVMREQGSGKIMNISSIAGLMGLPFRSIYSASKFAVEGMTEALRSEVAKFGIQVCTIQPGSIRTNIKDSRASHLPRLSPYQPELDKTEKIIDQEVKDGVDVSEVSRLIVSLIAKKKLQSKYVVAKPFQRAVAGWIRRLLPRSIFESLLKRHYDI